MPALTTSDAHEVAAWMRRWRDLPVMVESKPLRITTGRMVFDAEAVKRLVPRREG